MNNILITSAGQRVSLVRFFKKELKLLNANNKVYTVDLNPKLAPACYVSDGCKAIVRVTDDEYISQLLSICISWDIKLIVPTIDTELKVLSENAQVFLDKGIIPIVSEFHFIQRCRDKRLTNQFFVSHNIDIPIQYNKDNPDFPLFIKPYDGSLSKDIYLIQEKNELQDYHYLNPKLMFMEYIDQNEYDEYTVDTYYNRNSDLICAVPRKRIFVRAGEINKGVTVKNEIINYLEDKLSHIDGAIGCLTMQFFFHEKTKRMVGIEINPRFGGGYPLSYLAGANYPQYIIDEYILNKQLTYIDSWEDDLLMLRYDDEILVHNYEK